MKNLVENANSKLPKGDFVKDENFSFLKDIDLFSNKKAIAKEMLKGAKLPAR